MRPRNVALARAFPILIGILIFGAIIVFLALRTVRGVEQSEALAARFEGLGDLCEGSASNPGDASGFDPDNVRAVALRLVQGEWVYDATALPAEMRAAGPKEAQVVLCLGPSQPLATTACGVQEPGAAPTRVFGEALTARLLDAASGALLAQDVLRSAPQVGCRDEVGAVVRVDAERIGEWVAGEAGFGR